MLDEALYVSERLLKRRESNVGRNEELDELGCGSVRKHDSRDQHDGRGMIVYPLSATEMQIIRWVGYVLWLILGFLVLGSLVAVIGVGAPAVGATHEVTLCAAWSG